MPPSRHRVDGPARRPARWGFRPPDCGASGRKPVRPRARALPCCTAHRPSADVTGGADFRRSGLVARPRCGWRTSCPGATGGVERTGDEPALISVTVVTRVHLRLPPPHAVRHTNGEAADLQDKEKSPSAPTPRTREPRTRELDVPQRALTENDEADRALTLDLWRPLMAVPLS